MTNLTNARNSQRDIRSHYRPSSEMNRSRRPIQIPLPGKEFGIHDATPSHTSAYGATAAATQGGA